MITLEQFYRLANSFPAHPSHPASTRQPGVGVNGASGTSLPRQGGDRDRDRDFILARARAYLSTVPGAVSGQNGHSVTFRVACKLIQGFDLSPADALELLSEWNERCSPPWTPGDLHHKVDSAAAEPGARGYLLDASGEGNGSGGSGGIGGGDLPDASDIFKPKSAPSPAPAATPTPVPDPATPAPTAPVPARARSRPRPSIIINDDTILRRSIIEQSLATLAADPSIFVRDNLIVHVVCDSRPPKWLTRPERAPIITTMPQSVLNICLSTAINYCKRVGEVPNTINSPLDITPPWIGQAVDGWPDKASHGIRPLEAITTSPIFRADGQIIQHAGYDPDSGVLYQPEREYPLVPDSPTREDALAAVAALLDPVCDIAFEHACHQSAWLSLVLTFVSRLAINGCVPLFAADGNQRGVGKGLALDVACLIANGREPAKMAFPHDDVEIEKRLLSIAMAGDSVVCFDNINRQVGGASIEMALTARSIKSRILGVSKDAEMPLHAVFLASGNNLTFSDDCARRTIPIRLDLPEESPETRSNYRYPALRQHVREHHPRLLVAALTILRAYHVAGRPAQPITAYGSFQEWSDLVRSACIWLGLADPCEGRRALQETGDATRDAWVDIMDLLPDYHLDSAGVKLSEMLRECERRCKEHMNSEEAERMRDALIAVCRCKDRRLPSAVACGHAFRKKLRTVIKGRMLDCDTDRKDTKIWFVVDANSAGDAIHPRHSPASSPAHLTTDQVSNLDSSAGDAGDTIEVYTHAHTPAHPRVDCPESSPASPASPAEPDDSEPVYTDFDPE